LNLHIIKQKELVHENLQLNTIKTFYYLGPHKRKRNVNESQFLELSNEEHGTTSIKHQRLIEKDILENVEWLESNLFCLGEMIQHNWRESLDSFKFQKEHIEKEQFYKSVELEMFYYDRDFGKYK